MAVFANYPIALAPGMGLNAFFAFGVVLNMKINGAPVTWQMALAAVFIEGVIFAVLTLTNIREGIMNSIPKSLKIGISAGIGLFIAFIGLQNAGIVVNNDATLLGLGSIRGNIPMMMSMAGLIIMSVLTALNVKGALLIGIIVITAAAAALGLVEIPETFVSQPPSIMPLVGQLDFSLIKDPQFWVVVFTFFFLKFLKSSPKFICCLCGTSQKTFIAIIRGVVVLNKVAYINIFSPMCSLESSPRFFHSLISFL